MAFWEIDNVSGGKGRMKSGGAVWLRRLECQGGDIWFDSVYHLSCPCDSNLLLIWFEISCRLPFASQSIWMGS